MNRAAMRTRAIAWVASVAAIVALSGIASCGGSDNNSMSTMSTRFKSTILVSDGAFAASHTDPNLKNAWGIAFNPKGFVWVANNGTGTATLYDGNGVVQSLVVSIPPPAAAAPPARPASCSTAVRRISSYRRGENRAPPRSSSSAKAAR